jgi:hypothetical protein
MVSSRSIRIVVGCWVLALALSSTPSVVLAQPTNDIRLDNSDPIRFTLMLRGVSLTEALEEIVRTTRIDLVYDPEIIGSHTVYLSARNHTARELLQEILRETDLDFVTLSSGTFVLIRKARTPDARGSLGGIVSDARTGAPLPGATILLLRDNRFASTLASGTSSNNSGFFNLPGILAGEQEIMVSYVGYRPERARLVIPENGEIRTEVRLTPEAHLIEPLVIIDHQRRVPTQNTSREQLRPLDELNPYGRQDAVRGLSLFSGVQFQLPMADLHIQGSNSNEHRYFLDGVPVYQPYSFGHMLSAFSPFAIERVTIHKAGFDAASGSQIAGLVQLTHDIRGRATGQNLTLQSDPISANLRADLTVPIGRTSAETMIAVRTNLWDVYQDPTMRRTLRNWDYIDPVINNLLFDADDVFGTYQARRHQTDIQFSDVHLATRISFDPFRSLVASAYVGSNRVETDVLNSIVQEDPHFPEFMYARDRYRWQNVATRIRYDYLVGARTDISVQASYSQNSMSHNYHMAQNHDPSFATHNDMSVNEIFSMFQRQLHNAGAQSEDNRIRHGIMRSDLTYASSPGLRLRAGLQADLVSTQFDLTDVFFLPGAYDAGSVLAGGYTSADWFPDPQWHINAGTRLTWVSGKNQIYAEPRVSMQYDTDATPVGAWSVRLSGGLYRQFINHLSITNVGPSAIVPSVPVWTHASEMAIPKSWHATGSVLLEPVSGTLIKTETYLKWQPVTHYVSYPKLLTGTEAITKTRDFTEQTRSLQYGVGLTLSQNLLNDRIQLVSGYDYTVSRIDMPFQFGGWVSSPWNEPHRIRAMSLWRMSPSVRLYARWNGVYGRSWGFRQAYYDFMLIHERSDYSGFTFTSPEDDRLSAFHQIDAGVHYAIRFGTNRLQIQLDLMNLLNRRNVIDHSLVPVHNGADPDFKIHPRTLPGFTPTLSIQYGF